MPTLQQDNAIRKAAVLVRSLDSEATAAVLSRLSADEARALRAAVRELGEVTDAERRGLADELRGVPATPPGAQSPGAQSPGAQSPGAQSPGADHAGGVELRLDHAPPAPSLQPSETRPLAPGLESADPETLARYLRSERPQTVAVVLANLPPRRAADVLAELPEDQQPVVLDRLASLGDADPPSLDVVTAGLRAWLAETQLQQRRRSERLDAVQSILAAAPDALRRRLLDAADSKEWRGAVAPPVPLIEPPTPGVAERKPAEPEAAGPPTEATPTPPPTPTTLPTPEPPAPLLIDFDDIQRLPTAALAQVLRHAPTDCLLFALAGGSRRLLSRIERVLNRRQTADLRKRLSLVGPIRLSDLEHAQREVARVASDLARNGWIRLPDRRR